jgi:hypothetical protein
MLQTFIWGHRFRGFYPLLIENWWNHTKINLGQSLTIFLPLEILLLELNIVEVALM